MEEGVEPKFGPKLLELYHLQDQSRVREAYSIHHLEKYVKYATLQPVPGELLRKGRHRQDAGHDDCTSCHFCRQCTEDQKPRCVKCGKCFCAPCLSNRFGQNAAEMISLSTWVCPVCLDICNCSGATCRRAQLGLEPTASLIHEAQAFGYSSVAEYLIITALFREGTNQEAVKAIEWLVNPQRQFQARPFTVSAPGTGGQLYSVKHRKPSNVLSDRNATNGPNVMVKSKRPSLTAEERVSNQLNHLTSQLGFLSMQGLMSEVEALMPAIGKLKALPSAAHGPSGGVRMAPSSPGSRSRGAPHPQWNASAGGSGAAGPSAHSLWSDRRPGHVRDHLAASAPDSRPHGGHGAATSRGAAQAGMPQSRGGEQSSIHVAGPARPNFPPVQYDVAASGRQADVVPTQHIGPQRAGLQANYGGRGSAHVAQVGANAYARLSHTGTHSARVTAHTLELPHQRRASMAQRRVRSDVSGEAAEIWRRYEADLDRRHGVGEAALSTGVARHMMSESTTPAQMQQNSVSRQPGAQPGRHESQAQLLPRRSEALGSCPPSGVDISTARPAAAVATSPVESLDPIRHEAATQQVQREQLGCGPAACAKRADQRTSVPMTAASDDGDPGPATNLFLSDHAAEAGRVHPVTSVDNASARPALPQSVRPGTSGILQPGQDVALNRSRPQGGEQAVHAHEPSAPMQQGHSNAVECQGALPANIAPPDGAAVDTLDQPAERCVSGYMPSDAENVVAAHLLVRRTYTLAARGMELQQRDRIAMMLNKHRVAMEQWHSQPDPALEEPPAASWQRHGAEPIIVDAALCSLREAAAETGQTSSAGVEAFARTLDLCTGSAATCADLQDRTNALLTVGHSCILGAVSTGVYVETVKEGDETDQVAPAGEPPKKKISHSDMTSMLGVLRRHVTSLWPCIRRSNLDARVMRRIIGLDSFVDFERSDPAARGLLIHALQDMRSSLLQRHQRLFHSKSLQGATSWDKWAGQEREAAWKCVTMGARGLHKWATLLQSELHGLAQQRAPGTALIMLKALAHLPTQISALQWFLELVRLRMALSPQKGDGLQKVNEEACTLLLGNLMINLLKALNSAHEDVAALQQGPSAGNRGPSDAIHVFVSTMSTLVYALLGHSSEHSFWMHLLQACSGKHRASSMLLPLASSTLSEAFSLLSRTQELEPPAGHPAVQALGACLRHLPLCMKSAEEILPAIQACCSASSKTSGHWSNAALPSFAFMLGSAAASLHRCGRISLLQAVAPFGIDTNNTAETLLATSVNDTAQGGIICVLDRLASVAPAAMLEISGLLSSSSASGPFPWSLRWCILAGSLCDLANNRSSQGAAFWNGLLSVVTSHEIREYVDMWGDARMPDVDAIHKDIKGEIWGQWLAAALLSGMLPQEQMACPQNTLDVFFLKRSAPQGLPQLTLATAVTVVSCPDSADLMQGCRVAVAAVISISVYSTAYSQDVETRQLQVHQNNPDPQAHAIRHLLLLWAAFILQHAQLLISSPSLSSPSSSNVGTRSLVSATADIRAQARGSLLSGGHVHPACASLLSFFQALAGRMSPSTLLALPDSLCHPELLVPRCPALTPYSWQGQLISSMTIALLSRLPYASMYHVRIIDGASKGGPGDKPDSTEYVLPHNWPYQSLAADVILQEFAAAVGAFTTLEELQRWADSYPAVPAVAAQQQDCVSPFMFSFQHIVGQAEHGPASIQAACNAVACVRHIFNAPTVRGSSACVAAFKAILLPILELIPKAVARPTLALVQLELLLLLQAALPDLPSVFPSQEDAVHAAPPPGAAIGDSLTWYAVQQSLLCSLQALSDLLALPPAISQHMQQELGKINATQAIGLIQPGHCIWHVKRLSQMAPQTVLSTYRPHQTRWVIAAMLLIKNNEAEGILWRLLRKPDSGEGMEWIMQVLPRLGWLLVAGESWYCNGLALMGPPAAQLQVPLASWIQRRLRWLRQQYDDLIETLALLHDQDMQHVIGQSIPNEVLSAAQASAVAASARPQQRATYDADRSCEQRTMPNAPIARPPRPPPQPAASVALSRSRPKHSRKAGWVAQSLRGPTEHAEGHHKRMKMGPGTAGRGQDLHRLGSGAGASTPAQSLQQGSCCEWEDFDEHDPVRDTEIGTPIGSPCMASAHAQGMGSTQPNEAFALDTHQKSRSLVDTVPVPVLRPPAPAVEEEADSLPW